LNTVVRPPLESWAEPVPAQTLKHVKEMIGKQVEIIVDFHAHAEQPAHRHIERRILDIIQRRPATIEDLSSISGINTIELTKHMARLHEQGKVRIRRHKEKTFYELDGKEDI